jgi:hypothetical protein
MGRNDSWVIRQLGNLDPQTQKKSTCSNTRCDVLNTEAALLEVSGPKSICGRLREPLANR